MLIIRLDMESVVYFFLLIVVVLMIYRGIVDLKREKEYQTPRFLRNHRKKKKLALYVSRKMTDMNTIRRKDFSLTDWIKTDSLERNLSVIEKIIWNKLIELYKYPSKFHIYDVSDEIEENSRTALCMYGIAYHSLYGILDPLMYNPDIILNNRHYVFDDED